MPFDENEVKLLTVALENLHMMLCAIYEERFDTEFYKAKLLYNELISPNYVCPEIVLDSLTDIIRRYGKPSKILICYEELKAILSDFCNKIDLGLVVTKK